MSVSLKIISGGQTGADRAALDWALVHRVPHGGWCPQGRLAEDGPIPDHYQLRETPLADYAQRTEWNVRDADATVIFSLASELSGGSLRTLELARKYGKPCLHLTPNSPTASQAKRLRAFLDEHQVKVLNVAGPRASQEQELARFVTEILNAAFGAD